MSRSQGFTLIEVAVVMVIAAILIVGILSTKTMLHNAKVKKVIEAVQDIRTAANLYYREYGRLPGDTAPYDGLITGSLESQSFTNDLINNRYLIGKTATASASAAAQGWENAFGGRVTVEAKTIATKLVNMMIVSGIPRIEDKAYIDLQLDDGNTTTGSVIVSGVGELWIPLN